MYIYIYVFQRKTKIKTKNIDDGMYTTEYLIR